MDIFLTICWRASLDRLCPLISTLINMESCHELTLSVFLVMDLHWVSNCAIHFPQLASASLMHALLTGLTTGHLLKVKISSLLLIAVLVSQSVSWAQKTNACCAHCFFGQIRWLVSNERHSGLFFNKRVICLCLSPLTSIMLVSRHAGASAACWSSRGHFPI